MPGPPQQRLLRCCGRDVGAGGDPDDPVRVDLRLPRLLTEEPPHPPPRTPNRDDEDAGDDPVGHRVQPVGAEGAAGVCGVQEHAEAGFDPARRLHGPGDPGSDGSCDAEKDGDDGGGDEGDDAEVRQLIPKRTTLPRRTHRIRPMLRVPEMRPRRITSPVTARAA